MPKKHVDNGGVTAHTIGHKGPPPTSADMAAARPTPTPVVSHDGDDAVWLGAPAAARRLGVVLRTLYKAIDAGDLPAYRFGRLLKLKRADVDAYIESRRIEPGTITHLAMADPKYRTPGRQRRPRRPSAH